MTGGRLSGRAAIVTGGTTGIGYGIARRFVIEDAAVVVAGLGADVEKAVEALSSEVRGATVAGHQDDLSRPGAGSRLVDAAMASLGRIDILVNNAGGGVIAPTYSHTEETLRKTIDNNLWTTLYCTLAVLPVMDRAGYGRIVNIGAESVRNGLDSHAVYNAAKGGVHALAVGWAREFATRGITVNTVAPSYTLTPELAETIEAGNLPEELEPVLRHALELIPMGRPATVEDIAAATLFLASDEAGFITGQVLSVNGGSSMG
jgi:2,3-dihydroxy-2,3-dihydro-p-cumate dehydrogenase